MRGGSEGLLGTCSSAWVVLMVLVFQRDTSQLACAMIEYINLYNTTYLPICQKEDEHHSIPINQLFFDL